MKKLGILLFYSLFLLLLGRQLTFLPAIETPREKVVKSANELRDKTKELISEAEGSYSVYYEDLETGDAFGIDHNTVLTAASLNKLPIVFYLYNLAGQDKIDLEEKIVLQKVDIQDYGTGVLRYEEPGGTYTLKGLAKLAFRHSDNTAAHLLTIKLGEGNIQSFVDSLGLSATSMAFNEASPRDVGMLLSLLFDRKITSESLTLELFDYLSDTEFEDRIPRYIGKKATVYHKIGDSTNMVHDAAVVSGENRKFILIIMTQGITKERDARELMGRIAEQIYGD